MQTNREVYRPSKCDAMIHRLDAKESYHEGSFIFVSSVVGKLRCQEEEC